MKNYRKKFIISFDPSGNWNEGKGTTGWCVFNSADDRITKCGEISAAAFDSLEKYWEAHIVLLHNLCDKYGVENISVVLEDYLLYSNKAKEQTNSRMETPQLLGVLKFYCWSQYIPYTLQTAAEVKIRWTNDILNYKKYIHKDGRNFRIIGQHGILSRHCLDSIRHAVHYATFKNQEDKHNCLEQEFVYGTKN